MKKLIFAAAVLFSTVFIQKADAQVSVSLGLNIGSQPDWGPVGYDHASYYYMPDIDAYYDVPAHRYVYMENNVWVHRTYLPARYSGYDRYHGYKVVVNDRNPWERHDVYRNRYASYRGRHDQAMIRESHEARYRNHWNDNGNHNRQGAHSRPETQRGGGQDNRGHGERGHDNRGHGDRGHGRGH